MWWSLDAAFLASSQEVPLRHGLYRTHEARVWPSQFSTLFHSFQRVPSCTDVSSVFTSFPQVNAFAEVSKCLCTFLPPNPQAQTQARAPRVLMGSGSQVAKYKETWGRHKTPEHSFSVGLLVCLELNLSQPTYGVPGLQQALCSELEAAPSPGWLVPKKLPV